MSIVWVLVVLEAEWVEVEWALEEWVEADMEVQEVDTVADGKLS